MDFIISIVIFILVFLVVHTLLSALNKKGVKMKYVMRMNKHIIFVIKVIVLFIIMFISSDVLHIENPFHEGLIRGFTVALACNVISTLIEEK